jgi:hypothetical protein
MHRQPILLMSIGLLLSVQCGREPELVFPTTSQTALVSGYFLPVESGTTIYLSDAVIIDSAVQDTDDGFFAFKNVVYGTYRIKARAPSGKSCAFIITVDQPIENAGRYMLSELPSQILSIDPRPGLRFDSTSMRFFTDSTVQVKINFREGVDSISLIKKITVSPDIPWRFTVSETYRTVIVSFGLDIFFRQRQLSIMIDSTAGLHTGELLDFAYTAAFDIDTASMRPMQRWVYFKSTVPRDGSEAVSPIEEVRFEFRKPVIPASAESLFTISPAIGTPNFFWNDDDGTQELYVLFPKRMSYRTSYTAGFQKGVIAADGDTAALPLLIGFTTILGGYSAFFPLNGADGIACDTPFSYSLNFNADTASFINAFSITPPVGDLRFVFSDYAAGSIIKVLHAPLIPYTTYAIRITATVYSEDGVRCPQTVRQMFSTRDTSIDSSTLVDTFPPVWSKPADTLQRIAADADLMVVFRDSVNQQSVENRLHLLPPIPYNLRWSSTYNSAAKKDNHTLIINPMQPLPVNTLVTVSLDSGIVTAAGKHFDIAFTLRYKTEVLKVLSYSPKIGQINASRTEPIRIQFNAPVDTLSLLANLTAQPTMGVVSIDTSLLSAISLAYILKHDTLSAGTTYSLTLLPAVSDIYGATMGTPFTLTFTTGK